MNNETVWVGRRDMPMRIDIPDVVESETDLREQRDRARAIAVELEQQIATVALVHQKYTDGEGDFCIECSAIGWPCRTAAALGVVG